MFIVDAHCDTLHAMLKKKEKFGKNNLQIDYVKMQKSSRIGMLQFFAVFESPGLDIERQEADVSNMIELYHGIIKKYNVNIIKSKKDLKRNGLNGLLSIEGLYFMEGNVNYIDSLYDRDVRCISLTWNPDNEFSGGVGGEKGSGLSAKGRKLVNKAIDKGILIDVSHLSDKGFWDIERIAIQKNKPFVATHSNVRSICSNRRNLDDEMLKAIAGTGGLSGINMYSCFLNDSCSANEEDAVRHIEYICSLTGPGHVGFGCDFDGIDINKSAVPGPWAINTILEKLLRLNYSESDVLNIASGNFIRVLEKVLD